MRSALVQAWRAWSSARAVAALAIVAFAVGIGAATAIFSVVNGVLLKPLPYATPERFVAIYSASFSQPEQYGAHRFPDLIEYKERLQSFDVFGWFRPASFTVMIEDEPHRVDGAAVTPALAQGLRVAPMIGQWFNDENSAVISSALWRRMGSPADVVGQLIRLDARSFTVTGVMPASFRLPVAGPGVERTSGEVWIPLDPLGKGQDPGEGFNFCYARLKEGVTFAQAEEETRRVAADIAARDPVAHPSYTVKVNSLRESVIVEIKPTLQLLAVAAGVLLLITCADVAGLLLTRSIARARETAIRVALGAGYSQLALHHLFEGVMVALAGAAAGLLLSVALVRAVLSIAADYIPRANDISLDRGVIAFALLTAVAASVIASLAPLWQAIRTAPSDALNQGVRASASLRARRLSRSLVIAQLGLAFVLLTISAVLIVNLRGLRRVPTGFDPNDLLTFQMTMKDGGADSIAARVALHAQDAFTATGSGTGSGVLRWSRASGDLAPGTYIDTITVHVDGLSGSPARYIDTLVVSQTREIVGDVDRDGSITTGDALIILRSLVALPILSGAVLANGDANCDGRITAADAQLILQLDIGIPPEGSCLGRPRLSIAATLPP